MPHSAGGTSASKGVTFYSESSGTEKGHKSIFELIKEKLEKKLEEQKEQEKRDAAKQARQDMLEISVEAAAKVKSEAAEKVDAADAITTPLEDEETVGGALNILA